MKDNMKIMLRVDEAINTKIICGDTSPETRLVRDAIRAGNELSQKPDCYEFVIQTVSGNDCLRLDNDAKAFIQILFKDNVNDDWRTLRAGTVCMNMSNLPTRYNSLDGEQRMVHIEANKCACRQG